MKDSAKGQAYFADDKEARWVARYRASGMGLRQFAEQHGLSPVRLHYWVYQKHAQAGGLPPTPGFAEVKVTGVMPGPWVAEVGLPSGSTLRFKAEAEPAWVAALVRSLRGVC